MTTLEHYLLIEELEKKEKDYSMSKGVQKMGMTIDNAIKRYQCNAEYERTHGNLQGCLEFRQLVEWLEQLQKIKQIANDKNINGDLLRMSEIKWVLENENDN